MQPYVAQDSDGGWYADAGGVMQDPDKTRTREQALEWAMDRMYHLLCRQGPELADAVNNWTKHERLLAARDAEVARLREALAPFAEAMREMEIEEDNLDNIVVEFGNDQLTSRHFVNLMNAYDNPTKGK